MHEDTTLGLALESDLISLYDSYVDVEEEKGFLNEQEVARYLIDLEKMCHRLAELLVIKERKTNEVIERAQRLDQGEAF